MTTMRDRLALAISGSGVTSRASLRKADAVIAELENPTPEMIDAMIPDTGNVFLFVDRAEFLSAFVAAIRAAKE